MRKKELHLPKQVKNVITCRNPRCITSIEQELDQIFLLTDEEKKSTAANTAKKNTGIPTADKPTVPFEGISSITGRTENRKFRNNHTAAKIFEAKFKYFFHAAAGISFRVSSTFGFSGGVRQIRDNERTF